jgi:hypothetical protein
MSKYLPTDPCAFLPEPLVGPDDFFRPPDSFLASLQKVFNSDVPTPTKPPVRFDVHQHDLQFNSELLRDYDYDFEKFLAEQSGSTLDFGSEFRPLDQLIQVLGTHPNFPELSEIVTTGMPYRYEVELSEEERVTELTAMLERGNHKSAKDEPAEVSKLLLKDVTHGFSMPVLPSIIPKLMKALVQPFGMAKQTTLTELGERQVKYRLTQDLSFSLTGDRRSVNSRIDMSAYVGMIYGWCLLRLIHFIVALRAKFPQSRILICKYDYSDAYRRIAHAAHAAVQSIAVFAGIAYIALRMTFGGSPNPPTWCMFSEMVTDLSNEIILLPTWDPETLRSPAQPLTPPPDLLNDSIPLAQARPLALVIPLSVTCRTDGFIDDLITTFLDTAENRARCPHATPLAMHLTSRPHAGTAEPITRRNILSDAKLIAEGTPAEVQTVLGWYLNTRALLIALPLDKFDTWSRDVTTMATTGKTTFGELDTTVGRLNHASHIIPLARHFLNRLRLRVKSRHPKLQEITFSPAEIADLLLWLVFLSHANRGISMNRITTRQPSKIAWSDACPFGIGGYTLAGRGWRIQIPPLSLIFGSDVVNNLLEFIGMVINVWLICLEAHPLSECILAIGDNTSAIGWLFKSGKMPTDTATYDAIQMVARKLGSLVTESEHCLASQHIKGTDNVVSDLLSYSGSTRGKPHPLAADHPSDAELTQRFHTFLPSQIPPNFSISPLPNEILCWVSQVLQTVESSLTRSKKPDTKRPTASGAAGNTSAHAAGLTMTPSLLTCRHQKRNSSSGPSSNSIEKPTGILTANLQDGVKSRWSAALCEMPQAVWLRRFGTITNQAPYTSRTATSCTQPSEASSEPSITSTPRPTAKKRSHPGSSAASTRPREPQILSSVTAPLPSLLISSSEPGSSPCAPVNSLPPQPPAEPKLLTSADSSSGTGAAASLTTRTPPFSPPSTSRSSLRIKRMATRSTPAPSAGPRTRSSAR